MIQAASDEHGHINDSQRVYAIKPTTAWTWPLAVVISVVITVVTSVVITVITVITVVTTVVITVREKSPTKCKRREKEGRTEDGHGLKESIKQMGQAKQQTQKSG